MELRTGLHTGEIELRQGGIGGITVHIAARVMDLADSGGVFVSRTVKDLLMGSGVGFSLHGTHTLKGVPGLWEIWQVDDG